MSSRARRLLALAGRHRLAIGVGFGLLLVTNALNVSIPLLLKAAFDAMGQGTTGAHLALLAGTVALVAILRGAVRTGSRLALLGTSRRVVAELREEVFAHVVRLPMEAFDRRPTGDLVSRMISDLVHVRSLFGPVMMNVANTGVLYVFALALLLQLDVVLTFVALAPYAAVAALVRRLGKRMHGESTAAQAALADVSSRLSEVLNGITVVKSARREEEEARIFDALTDRTYEANSRFARTRSIVVPLMGGVGSVGTLAVLLIGGLRVMAGTFSVGDFVAFTTTLGLLTWPSIALGWILNSFQRGMAAMDRLEDLLAEPVEPEQDDSRLPGPGLVEARGLTFSYPDAADPALAEVSFTLPPGGRLGLVGPPGSGKSTLVDLLLGLRLPPRGQLAVDGADIHDVPLGAWRRRLGVVPQGAFAFSTTLRENVAYADDVPEHQDRAVRDAALTKDLPQLPDGLDTVIGERGVTLSGGQRQRLTLARALAVEPDLLVLDDSLSAVDAETEREILAHLETRRQGRALSEVIVSHRLSAVSGCDEILVLDHGRVAERGTHGELLDLGGEYARTWAEQEMERQLEEVE